MKNIKRNLQRITKIEPFISKYNWEGINAPSEKDDWKKCEKIMYQLLLMFCMLKQKKIYPAYVSKCNSSLEKQIILLMIPNGEKWHYLAVKKLSALLR